MSMRQRLGRILHQYKCCFCSSSQHFCRRQRAGRWNTSVFSSSDAWDQIPGVLCFDNLPAIVRAPVCYMADSNCTAWLSSAPRWACGGVGVLSGYEQARPSQLVRWVKKLSSKAAAECSRPGDACPVLLDSERSLLQCWKESERAELGRKEKRRTDSWTVPTWGKRLFWWRRKSFLKHQLAETQTKPLVRFWERE